MRTSGMFKFMENVPLTSAPDVRLHVPDTFNNIGVVIVNVFTSVFIAGFILNVNMCGIKLSIFVDAVYVHFIVGSSFNSVAYVGDTLKL